MNYVLLYDNVCQFLSHKTAADIFLTDDVIGIVNNCHPSKVFFTGCGVSSIVSKIRLNETGQIFKYTYMHIHVHTTKL
jgi:hypothetical protein